EQTEQVVPFIGTVGLFIMLTNLLSLFKIPPPAKNPAFPIAMALLTIVYIIVQSIRFVGLRGFFASLVYPKAMLLPFKLLDYVIKPLSLSLRLFGNVFGAFILMEFVYLILPVFLPGIVGIWFDLADGILQAVIFTYLTATYIGEVLESAEMSKQARQQKKSMQAASV
ncbi:MAG: F0F1 ATP synthase subunit A, partial [Eubacteriales bacterium]|nr:F0F1 ATP synthase subunit A [Eubacteriales bacterium]